MIYLSKNRATNYLQLLAVDLDIEAAYLLRFSLQGSNMWQVSGESLTFVSYCNNQAVFAITEALPPQLEASNLALIDTDGISVLAQEAVYIN